MRIAVIDADRCEPKKCATECIKYCPGVRTGGETIVLSEETGRPVISEELCTGCGICPKKCPLGAIHIIGLPDELEGELVHGYGENAFRIFRLPYPQDNAVTGLIGQNGIGKTTIVKILSGNLIPNFGNFEKSSNTANVLNYFSGTQFHNYFSALYSGKIKAVVKPQYADSLANVKGEVGALLKKADERGALKSIAPKLELENVLKKRIREISGGELQRVAIAAAILREGDVYIFDEPSSYLDVEQRLKVAGVIRELAAEKKVLVVEHDLIVLDYLADYVTVIYGTPGAYGVVSHPRGVKEGINAYLGGYLKEENIRFRTEPVRFEVRAPSESRKKIITARFKNLRKTYDGFKLNVKGGEIDKGEVIGILGPNATGKTTFVKMLAGALEPDEGEIDVRVKVSYKPQYIKPESDATVAKALSKAGIHDDAFFKAEIATPLGIEPLFDRDLNGLGGGELQRVAIAVCLCRGADIYLLDEPSAYLDVEQRLKVAKMIRRVIEKRGATGIVVDHDLLFADYISDRIIVFYGTPGVSGSSTGPLSMKDGMNAFLKDVKVTFRRDPETGRPRANKPESRMDKEQKTEGEYYYQ